YTVSGLMLTGADAVNYALQGGSSAVITGTDGLIKQRELRVIPDSGQSKAFGEVDPVLTFTVDPQLLIGDSFTGMLQREDGEAVGSFSILLGTLTAGPNYQLQLSNEIFKIIGDDDRAPEITSDLEIEEDDEGSLIVMAELSEGEQEVGSFEADEPMTWTLEQVGDEDFTVLFEMEVDADGAIVLSFKEGSVSGIYEVNLCATDASGNKTCVLASVEVIDDTAPEITSDLEIEEDDQGLFSVFAELSEGEQEVGSFEADEPVTWTIEHVGDEDFTVLFEMEVDADGAVVLSFKEGSVSGIYEVNLCATDASGNKTCVLVSVEVIDDRAPEITSDLEIEEDDEGSFSVFAELSEGEQEVGSFEADEPVTWTLEQVGEEDFTVLFEMEVDADGAVVLSFKEGSVSGIYEVNLCATDASGNKTCVLVSVEVIDDRAPEITSDLEIEEDDEGSFSVFAELSEGEQEVGSFEADELVTWTLEQVGDEDFTVLFEMEVDADGAIVLSFKEGSVAGIYEVNLCATDASGNKTCVLVSIEVIDDTAPEITSDLEIEEDDQGSFSFLAELSEGEQGVGSFEADEPVTWTLEHAGEEDFTGLFEMITRFDGSMVLRFVDNSFPGIYMVKLCATDFSGNKTCSEVKIIIQGEVSLVIPSSWIEINWGSNISVPRQQEIMTVDGNILKLAVELDETPLNRFRSGDYRLTGELIIPLYLQNDRMLQADIRVRVLPKPAPQDVLLSNNTFEGIKTSQELAIGSLTVVDPVDNMHWLGLLDGLEDNRYFKVINDVLYWSSEDPAAGRTTFKVVVRVTDRDFNTLDKVFEITRNRERVSEIEIYNTFTPDGDGINDNWGVPEIRYYTGARVQVFERSGKRLFYTEDPDQRWDGIFEGKEMPVGSYYWTLEVRETGEVRKGILNLLRK
ncbi:T9SS type B sorting domain-containing protein, partial [Belliella aquatica]